MTVVVCRVSLAWRSRNVYHGVMGCTSCGSHSTLICIAECPASRVTRRARVSWESWTCPGPPRDEKHGISC